MATNTILQYLDQANADGEDYGFPSNRQQKETFVASEQISDGDLVCLDISKTSDGDKMVHIKKLKTDVGLTAVAIGVADEDIASGASGEVIIRGFKASANIATGAGVGERFVGTSTAGRGDVLVASSTIPALGYVITLAADNTADVYIIKQF
jgi:hypothetical protein